MTKFIEQMEILSKQIVPSVKCNWFDDLRVKSMEAFLSAGLPYRKQENWKYTSVHAFSEKIFQVVKDYTLLQDELNSFSSDCYDIVMINGRYNQKFSTVPDNIEIIPILGAIKKNKKQIETVLSATEIDKNQQFVLLNASLIQDGVFINIPENIVLDKPIRLLSLWKTQEAEINNVRNVIFIGENSEVKIVDEYQGINSSVYFNNTVSHYILNKNAKLTYEKIQNESQEAYHISHTDFQCAENSVVNTLHVGEGAGLARDDICFDLNGEGAECKLRGLYLPSNNQHMDYHTVINHNVAHTESDELFKGVIEGKGVAVFNGRVFVEKDAQKISANQSNKNILLSKTAEVYTKPELEIYADDVKCSHGATVGRLDEKALFYLRSRGIEKSKAERILLNAFIGDIVPQ